MSAIVGGVLFGRLGDVTILPLNPVYHCILMLE